MKAADKIKSFTLVELLIVIAILAILAAAVVIVINPGEMLAEARDSQRVTDIKSIKDAVDLFIIDNPGATLGIDQRVYISLPDTSATCDNITGLPALPANWYYRCVTEANLRNTNSSGWLPLNLSLIKGGSPIPSLPIDPQNDLTTTRYYQYIPGSVSGNYELTTLLESEKQSKAAAKDGGIDSGRLETGTNMNLWRTASGLAGYWPFDGNGTVTSGSTAGLQDLSGNNNNGTAENANGTGMSFVAGKFGNAIQLDGIDDDVATANSSLFDLAATSSTFSVWIKTNTPPIDSPGIIMRKFSGGTPGGGYWIAMGTNGALSVDMRGDGGDNPSQSTSSTYADGNWHLFMVTLDMTAKRCYLYVDGKLAISDPYLGNLLNSPEVLYIGGSSNSYNFLGAVDELRIYRRLLSLGEIQAMYNAGK